MMKQRILLVEDEQLIGEMVKLNLEEDGYKVTWLTESDSVYATVEATVFDLIVLDVMLPGQYDGLALARGLRRREIGTAILMLTARSETSAKVQALDSGADDYLTKPFDMPEFLARVRALIRRSQSAIELPSSQKIRVGGFDINLETRIADTQEGSLTLSDKEAALLALFVRNPGRTLSRADILEEVWGMDVTPTERTVDNFIVRMRKLFEPLPEEPRHFITVRAQGYRYEP
jgi:DNA-binding response OmpR family regulator